MEPTKFIDIIRHIRDVLYPDLVSKYNLMIGINPAGLDGKVDKITGKGLSTEDYTTLEKNKLGLIDMSLVEMLERKGMPSGYVPLDASGKINPQYLSSLSVIDVHTPVDEASMLALAQANVGDISFRQDNQNSYQLVAMPASTLSNWKQLNMVGVSSINGQIGIVSLSTDDIPEGFVNQYFTNERVDDRVAALITAGLNISLAYDDISGTLTISGIDAYTKTQTDSNIAAAIAALVDASPATLDTINEIAAALGDDPNFATTITTLIGTKAPINNPVFTGSIGLPKWTNATRPTFGVDDRATGFNTDIGTQETWNGTAWVASTDIAAMVHAATEKTSIAADDELLILDSAASFGLKKVKKTTLKNELSNESNYIIDGRFNFWFEGISQTSSGYGSDTMWANNHNGSTKTHTRQSFAVGETFPDGVLCPAYFSRTVVASVAGANNFVHKAHYIEDVRKLAGKTVPISFYARVDSNKNIGLRIQQAFGSGGSPSAAVDGIAAQQFSLTTSWQKFTAMVTIPSISGKVLGTTPNTSFTMVSFGFDIGSSISSAYGGLGQQSGTFDIALIQLGYGSDNSIDIEEIKVMRYFETSYNRNQTVGQAATTASSIWWISTATKLLLSIPYKVKKRIAPAITYYSPSTGAVGNCFNGSGLGDQSVTTGGVVGEFSTMVYKVSGGTAGNEYMVHFVADSRL